MTGNVSKSANGPAEQAGAVCIVGSGPSGLYAADAILRKRPGCAVDVIDRLPTPYGLVRAGVAPDHQGTKNIVRQFERTLQKPGVRFLGNVAVGRDVTYDELKAAYDAVILAIGAPRDRTLGLPGEDLDGVYGSGRFVGWYNGHPDHADLAPRIGMGVAIVGNGNVALDIARILAKTPEEMAQSDICAHAADTIATAPVTDIYICGRRGPVEASFTSAELAEMGHLRRARPVVDAAALDGASTEAVEDPRSRKIKDKNLEILRAFAARPDDDMPVRVHFLFNAAPRTIQGENGAVTALTVERTRVEEGRAVGTGETFDLSVGTVITAIGYRTEPITGLPLDQARGTVANSDGVVEDGVFAVGWAKRGPSGVIPSNRADSMAVADKVAAYLEVAGGTAEGPAALDRLLAANGARPVTFEEWQVLNAAEVSRAPAGRPREKFVRVADMLAHLD